MTKPTQWLCRGCGATLTGRGGKRYCGPDCRPRCSIPDCQKAQHTRSLCSAHATRELRTGDALTPFERQPNVGECSIPDCTQPMRKTGWCASHYAQAYRSGDDPKPFTYKWSERTACLMCGAEPGGGYRRFCSAACFVLFRRHDGARPLSVECALCGVEIDLTVRGEKGQLKKACTKLCRPCRRDYRKYGMSARQLAQRDGTDCHICGDPVDMELAFTGHLMRPSVDHIVPRARGGSHDPENLALAHLLCNQIKSDRLVVFQK